MSVSAETPRISAGFITGSLWAGFASAVICSRRSGSGATLTGLSWAARPAETQTVEEWLGDKMRQCCDIGYILWCF